MKMQSVLPMPLETFVPGLAISQIWFFSLVSRSMWLACAIPFAFLVLSGFFIVSAWTEDGVQVTAWRGFVLVIAMLPVWVMLVRLLHSTAG